MLWLGILLISLGIIWLLNRPKSLKKPPQSVRDPNFQYARSLHSKIRGVSFRQEVVSRCREGEALYFIREPDNPFGHNAIAIHRAQSGEQLGYLSRHLAEEFSKKVDSGRWQLSGHISDVTGGGKKTIGLNIQIDLYHRVKLKAATG